MQGNRIPENPYNVVMQDVRGSLMSEGQFVDMTPHLDKKTGPKDVARFPFGRDRVTGSR